MKLQVLFRVAVVVMIAAVAAACGASSAQVAKARDARYNAPVKDVFQGAANGTTAASYQIEGMDATVPMLRTVAKWYEADGSTEDSTADGDAQIRGGSVLLAFDVAVRGKEGEWYIVVTPVASQVVAGMAQGRVLAPDDPAMPGWVQGKIDSLYVSINGKLSAHVVEENPLPAPGY